MSQECFSLQGCPEGADICFEIELLSFDKTPHWHGMTAGDKIRRAEQVRQQGNVVFRQGQLDTCCGFLGM